MGGYLKKPSTSFQAASLSFFFLLIIYSISHGLLSDESLHAFPLFLQKYSSIRQKIILVLYFNAKILSLLVS